MENRVKVFEKNNYIWEYFLQVLEDGTNAKAGIKNYFKFKFTGFQKRTVWACMHKWCESSKALQI